MPIKNYDNYVSSSPNFNKKVVRKMLGESEEEVKKEEEKKEEKKEGETKEEEKKEEEEVKELKDATFPLIGEEKEEGKKGEEKKGEKKGGKKEEKKEGGKVKLLAIDCEMCMTEDGLELTRLSAVNESLEV